MLRQRVGRVRRVARVGTAGVVAPLASRIAAVVGAGASIYLPGPSYFFADAAKTTPCADTDPCYTWADASANGRDLTQATLGFRPLARLIGGKWRLVFDGADDWMVFDASSTVGSYGGVLLYSGATFPAFSAVINGDTTGAGLLAGFSGTANFIPEVLGLAGRTTVNGVSTLTILPAPNLTRVLSYATAAQTSSRLVVGGNRGVYPPNSRFWPGSMAAIIIDPLIWTAGQQADLELLLAEMQ